MTGSKSTDDAGVGGGSTGTAREEPRMMTVPLRTIRRGYKACQLCKQQKVRCEGGNPEAGQPCRRCVEAGASCSVAAEKVPTMSERIVTLEEEVSSLKTSLREFKTLSATIFGKIAASAGVEEPEEVNELESDARSTPALATAPSTLPNGKKRGRRRSLPAEAVDESTAASKKLRKDVDETLLEQATEIFLHRCAPYLPYIDLSATPGELLAKTKKDSELLYHAIVAAGSREAEELRNLHDRFHSELLSLVRSTLFGPATVHDLQGLLIYIQFLTDAKYTGNAVDIAWSLELHLAGDRLALSLRESSTSPETLRYAEQIRVLGCLFNVERRAAVLAGKPSLFGDHPVITESLALLTSLAMATDQDRRMLMCAELLSFTYNHVRDHSHVDGARPINDSNLGRLREASSCLDIWYHRWITWATFVPDDPGMFTMQASVEINYAFAKFHLYCHYVGSISDIRDASSTHFELVRTAIEHAMTSLRTAIDYFKPPVINYTTRVLCTTITFACLFSLKMANLHPALCHPPDVLATAKQIEELFGHYSDKRFAQAIGSALQASQSDSQWLAQEPQSNEHSEAVIENADFVDFDFSEALRFLSAQDSTAVVPFENWQQSIPDDLFLCPQMGSLSSSALEEFMRL